MPSPFDALPPPNPKFFRQTIRERLKDVVRSFSAFAVSVKAGRKPDWPPSATLELFTAQLAAFRQISNRRKGARPIELVREIDHRWKGLRLKITLNRVVSALNDYSGKSLLGKAFVEAFATGSFQDHPLVTLILGKRKATIADLPTMLALTPRSFEEIHNSLANLSPGRGIQVLASSSLIKARKALALSAQQYLASEHRSFMCRQTMAFPLRNLLYELNDPLIRKRLFGCSDEEIEAWKVLDITLDREKRNAQQRSRSARFRAKRKTNPPCSVTL